MALHGSFHLVLIPCAALSVCLLPVLPASSWSCLLCSPSNQFFDRRSKLHTCLTTAVLCCCAVLGTPRSEVECCKDQDYYPKETEEASTPSITPLTAGKVGTCDWDADLFTEKECATPSADSANPDTPCGFIELANGAFQIGTAWATWYVSTAGFCLVLVHIFWVQRSP